jgi:two-component system, NarL family, nitrate/nitrite response regulator NarL
MPPPRVRVVVADDHPLFREGIERAVRERPELELVAAAADGRQALDTIRDLEPHVAVLDLRPTANRSSMRSRPSPVAAR